MEMVKVEIKDRYHIYLCRAGGAKLPFGEGTEWLMALTVTRETTLDQAMAMPRDRWQLHRSSWMLGSVLFQHLHMGWLPIHALGDTMGDPQLSWPTETAFDALRHLSFEANPSWTRGSRP